MVAFDPYQVLGVERTATLGEIKAAYRARSKASHPDAGGNAEAFSRVSFSHEVLSDPERRARYDATGEWDDRAEANPDAEAFELLGQLLGQALSGEADPNTHDLLGTMVAALDQGIETLDKPRRTMVRARDRAKRILAKLSTADGKPNKIAGVVNWQLQQIEHALAIADHKIAQHRRAIEIIEDHKFEWDRPYAFGMGGLQDPFRRSFG